MGYDAAIGLGAGAGLPVMGDPYLSKYGISRFEPFLKCIALKITVSDFPDVASVELLVPKFEFL
jgi:hypothetical protein